MDAEGAAFADQGHANVVIVAPLLERDGSRSAVSNCRLCHEQAER